MSIEISEPKQNQIIAPGTVVLVAGAAVDGDPDTRRAPRPEGVTYQVDGGPVGSLEWQAKVSGYATQVTFQGPVGVLSLGSHTITVTAEFSLDSFTDSVTATIGQPPVDSNLVGDFSLEPVMSLTISDTVGLRFTPPSSVEITSFPELTIPLSSGDLLWTWTVALLGSGPGDFSGSGITIQDVVLGVAATLTGPGGTLGPQTAQLLTTLSTDNPGGEMDGALVVLAGNATFSDPVFGMTDFGIQIGGLLSVTPP